MATIKKEKQEIIVDKNVEKLELVCTAESCSCCVHCSIIHKSPKVEATQVSSKGEWINKTWGIYPVEYYAAFKRKEIVTHAITSMNLDDIMLKEISKTQEGK